MKKRITSITLTLGFTVFVAFQGFTNSGGAPQGRNGSPSSVSTCAASGCHAGGPAITVETITVTTDIPAAGFEENTNYSITVTANSGSRNLGVIGFEASVENQNGHQGSISSNSSSTRMTGNFITHTSSGNSATNGINSWTFDWDSDSAPDSVTVYVAANFANGNGVTSGDAIATETLLLRKNNSVGLTENVAPAMSLFPNPVKTVATLKNVSPDATALYLYDLSGKMVQTFNESFRIESGLWRLDFSDLPKGTYFMVNDHNNTRIKVRKF